METSDFHFQGARMKNPSRLLLFALAIASVASTATAQKIPDDLRQRVVANFKDQILPMLPKSSSEFTQFAANSVHTAKPAGQQNPRDIQTKISQLGAKTAISKGSGPAVGSLTIGTLGSAGSNRIAPPLGEGNAVNFSGMAIKPMPISLNTAPVRPNFALSVTPVIERGDTAQAFVYALSNNDHFLLGLVFKQDGRGGITVSPEFFVDTFSTTGNNNGNTFIGQTFKVWESRIDSDYADGLHGVALFEFDRNGVFYNTYFAEFTVGIAAARGMQIDATFVINLPPPINQTFLFLQGRFPTNPVSVTLCFEGFCVPSSSDLVASNGTLFLQSPLSLGGSGQIALPASVVVQESSSGNSTTASGKILIH